MVINVIKLVVISRGSHHDVDFSFLNALKLSHYILYLLGVPIIRLRLFYLYFP